MIATVMLRDLPNGYTLKRPITLFIEHVGSVFIADAAELDFPHSISDTPEEAVENYRWALADYYEWLREHRDELQPHLVEQLVALEEFVEKKND